MAKKKATKKKTAKKQLKKSPAKKSKKKIAEQKKLIRAIRTPERFFKIDFGRYGGEVAMGTITEAQYNYWADRDQSEFEEHMNMAEWGEDQQDEAYKQVPEEARFTKPFFEYGDICHMSGPEFSDGQYMLISEVDKDGQALQDDEGNFLEDRQIDMKDFKKLGVKVKCVAEHNSGSKSCKDKFYIFGQYFNKGGWYTSEPIKTGPAGLDFKKIEINYENCDGFRVFNEFTYDGESHYLEEDSTGKSSAFYVGAGDDV
jgi:hypothetical protein